VSDGDDPRGTRAFYDAIAGRYDRVYAARVDGKARLAEVCRALAPTSRTLVLGVGTGRELSTLCDAGHAPTGLDFSERMLEKAARRGRPVPLVQGDFWAPLPFARRSFDGAVALHGTLAHSPSDDAVRGLARELSRVLVPGTSARVFAAETWRDLLAPFDVRVVEREDELLLLGTNPSPLSSSSDDGR
jgi:ubiquinone/menaquinone biosynthesis C-methylase UbiE